MVPEFVDRTGGSEWLSALPTGSKWQSALPTGLADLQQHRVLLVHLHDQQAFLFKPLHDVREALEADLALVEIGVLGLYGGLEDGGIDALEAVVLELGQAVAEGGQPVVLVQLRGGAASSPAFRPTMSAEFSVQDLISGLLAVTMEMNLPKVEQP